MDQFSGLARCFVCHNNVPVEGSNSCCVPLANGASPLARKLQCEGELTAAGRRHSRVWYSSIWLQRGFANRVHSQHY